MTEDGERTIISNILGADRGSLEKIGELRKKYLDVITDKAIHIMEALNYLGIGRSVDTSRTLQFISELILLDIKEIKH